MIKEALLYLQDIMQRAGEPLRIDDDTDVELREGTLIAQKRRPPAIHLTALYDVVSFVRDYLERVETTIHVFVHSHGIAVWDEDRCLSIAGVSFCSSVWRHRLLRHVNAEPTLFSHADFLALFRHYLADVTPEGFLAPFEVLDFARMTNNRSASERNADTLGVSVENKVNSVATLPETVTLAMPLWENPGINGLYGVRLRIIVRPSDLAHPFALLIENLSVQEQVAAEQATTGLATELKEFESVVVLGGHGRVR